MPKTTTTRQVSHSTTEYRSELQRRDGKIVAIIEAVTVDHYKDGRGYAGTEETRRQVLVVPMRSLPSLASEIATLLAFQADPNEDSYDLRENVEPRIGLYVIDAPGLAPRLVYAWHTLAEARYGCEAFRGKEGTFLAHLPKEGEEVVYNIIERID